MKWKYLRFVGDTETPREWKKNQLSSGYKFKKIYTFCLIEIRKKNSHAADKHGARLGALKLYMKHTLFICIQSFVCWSVFRSLYNYYLITNRRSVQSITYFDAWPHDIYTHTELERGATDTMWMSRLFKCYRFVLIFCLFV